MIFELNSLILPSLMLLLYSFFSYNLVILFLAGYLGEEAKHLLHISTSMPLDAVQWNPENQDEVEMRR